MVVILDFELEQFSLFLIYKSPRCILQSFESVGLSIQEEKPKIDFQVGRHGSHLGFTIGMILAILIYKSPGCFLPSFESFGFSVQEKKRKIDFQDSRHGGHLGFQIRTILANFDVQVTPMLPTKFQVNWPSGVGVGFYCNC